MRLTENDKKQLKAMGYIEKDIPQIEQAISVTTYTYNTEHLLNGKKISKTEAIRVLGRKLWLTGIARSAFHWSACRQTGKGIVYFDSSKLFE